MRVEHPIDSFEREKQSILKDQYVSRSKEDSRDRKKKKSLQNKREFDGRKRQGLEEEQLRIEVKE